MQAIALIASNDDFGSQKEGVRQYLWNKWSQLFAEEEHPKSVEWFERLWKLHADDPARHYHTAVHVQELLQYFDLLHPRLTISVQDQRAVILAIFFHDAIYDATSSTNEEESMKLFQSFEANELVNEMIMASKAHHLASGTGKSPLEFFLDLDLSVLGKTTAAYKQYVSLIRKEYAHVPHETYCEKRAEILESILQQTYIYKTSLFREMFEEQARSNLASEIDLLRQSVIPG